MQKRNMAGFTLVEMLAVIVMIGILAATVFVRPSGRSIGLAPQAHQLANDIRYTQMLAMTRGDQRYCLILSASGYRLGKGSNCATSEAHPALGTTALFALDSASLSGYTATLTNGYVSFDGRGKPYISDAAALNNTASITLTSAGQTRVITITPETGRVQVQ